MTDKVMYYAPPITPEDLYLQDKRWRDKELERQKINREIKWSMEHHPHLWEGKDHYFATPTIHSEVVMPR